MIHSSLINNVTNVANTGNVASPISTKVSNIVTKKYIASSNVEQLTFTMFRLFLITTLICGSVVGQRSNASAAVFRASARQPKIINGLSTTIEKVPYQISLHERVNGNFYNFICGGSIISNFWVLTAGHCVAHNLNPDSYIVLAGTAIFGQSPGRSEHFLSLIHLHEGYHNVSSAEEIDNDLALLNVQTWFTFDIYRQPILLPPKNYIIPVRTLALTSGWGTTNSSILQPAAVLQAVSVQVIAKDVCASEWRNFNGNGKLCIGSYAYNMGTCSGDSGGPLVANNYLIGVTSWGSAPCLARSTIFTDVAYYRDWINWASGV